MRTRQELEQLLARHGFDLDELVGGPDRPDLEALAAKWIPRLRLGDWQIAVSYVEGLTMDGAPVHGLCSPFLERRRAKIEINDPRTPHDCDYPPTVEEVLVHELLHVAAAELARTGGVVAEEQLVDVLTSNLVHGERETVIRAMAVRSPTQKTRKASVIMNNNLDALVARVARIEAQIEDLSARVDALGDEPAPAAKKAPSRASSLGPRRDRSAPDVVARLNERMGFASSQARVERRGRELVLRPMTPEQARRVSSKGAA
ncbi:MAG: hypothetical protein IPM79_27590 [Polyangiaceae bacterium]|nr:hypothetical protein [Polyangiaceae bacterium]